MDQLYGTLGLKHSLDQDIVDPLLALQRRHAAHALTVRYADAIEIRILFESLFHAFAQIPPHDRRSVSRAVVVRVEVLLRHAMRLCQLTAHEDAPEDDVGVEIAL